MNPKPPAITIIPAFYDGKLSKPDNQPYLEIAEFFCNTIQGEGAEMGTPCAFLRFQWCTQNCVWCDTKEVWRFGNPYTFDEIFELMEHHDLINKFKDGQQLVITGGSPLRQQDALIQFLLIFEQTYSFLPLIQIENECTLMPKQELIRNVQTWNNSPKLASSGNAPHIRYKPEVLKKLSSLQNSWFKFVVGGLEDWDEIQMNFIDPGLIEKGQIILMPLGATREELEHNRPIALEMAVKHNVRYSTREHIAVWDKKTGV